MYLRFVVSRKLLTVTKRKFSSYNSNGLKGLSPSMLRSLSSFPVGLKITLSQPALQRQGQRNACKLPTGCSRPILGLRLYDLTYVQRGFYGNTFTTLSPTVRSSQIDLGQNWTCEQRRQYRSGRGNRAARQENDNSQPHSRSPQLMDFPWVIWPNLWHTIRNWIFANLIIRPYLDKEFTLSSFKSGAIQALVHVSRELSIGNFTDLEDLVTKPSLEEAQTNYALLSLKQRLDLAVVAEDIFFCFPYQIGVMFTNEGGPKERIFVEITMCYHIFKGFQDHVESISKSESPGTFKGVYDNYDRISIANYRFIREFTKGVEDHWTVNVANHFKPGEYLQRQ